MEHSTKLVQQALDMTVFNIHDAKTQFSKLVELASAGEEVVIAKSGKPVARLVRFQDRVERRKLGSMRGQFSLPDDFDSMGRQQIQGLFDGSL
jgi:prevent-host-death family protein